MIGDPVHPYGPEDAPLLVIGEAGGKHEGLKHQPFVGPSGWALRKRIRKFGLDDETEVRWANVIASQQGELSSDHGALAALVRRHWDDLTPVLTTASQHKAVLLVGRAALYRVTGYKGIAAESGSVYMDVDGFSGVPVVPVIHPASVMRSKLESKWLLVDAAVERAVKYAAGRHTYTPESQTPHFETADGYTLLFKGVPKLLEEGGTLAIDTEFNPNTGQPFDIGLSWDGQTVYHVPCDDSVALGVLKKLLASPRIIKVMQYMPADIGSLSQLGVDVSWPLWDTMVAQSILYSDLPGGLAKTALFYFDDWKNWKDMPHTDPMYNSIDVVATWRIQRRQLELLIARNLQDVFIKEAMPAALVYAALESRGMRVSYDNQLALEKRLTKEVDEQRRRISEFAEQMFRERLEPARVELAALEQQERDLTKPLDIGCLKHTKYNGMVKPRGKPDDNCVCAHLYVKRTADRETLALVRRKANRLQNHIDKWAYGFSPTNNEHLRWLLYDKAALGLPVQYNNKKPTANVDALRRLLASKRVLEDPPLTAFLADVTGVRQADKRISTFVWPVVDEHQVAHPTYRAGTGTGRVAGGSDKDLATERKQSEMSYNAMNIPENCRSIYIPHEANTKHRWFNAPEVEDPDDDVDDTTETEEEE